jgi:hypothetical protein
MEPDRSIPIPLPHLHDSPDAPPDLPTALIDAHATLSTTANETAKRAATIASDTRWSESERTRLLAVATSLAGRTREQPVSAVMHARAGDLETAASFLTAPAESNATYGLDRFNEASGPSSASPSVTTSALVLVLELGECLSIGELLERFPPRQEYPTASGRPAAAIRRRGKSFGHQTGDELHVCKFAGVGATVNQN